MTSVNHISRAMRIYYCRDKMILWLNTCILISDFLAWTLSLPSGSSVSVGELLICVLYVYSENSNSASWYCYKVSTFFKSCLSSSLILKKVMGLVPIQVSLRKKYTKCRLSNVKYIWHLALKTLAIIICCSHVSHSTHLIK